MNTLSVAGLVCLTTIFSGCNSDSAKVTQLESKVSSLEEKVAKLQLNMAVNEILGQGKYSALLTPGSEGYAPVHFDLGVLTVSLEDVQAYANGSKVKLRLGNLSSAGVSGLKATLKWGNLNANGVPDTANQKTKEVTFKEELDSGSWTNTSFVLDGVPPTELGYVQISEIAHTGIKLRR